MAAKDSLSLEYVTLVSLTDKFTTVMSMDCSTITQKLIAKGMIPVSCMSTANGTEVFDKVLKAVDINPENFATFLGVINECPWIKQLATLARDTYEEKKQQQAQEKVVNNIYQGFIQKGVLIACMWGNLICLAHKPPIAINDKVTL